MVMTYHCSISGLFALWCRTGLISEIRIIAADAATGAKHDETNKTRIGLKRELARESRLS